ncbi:cupin domain-containing protein [Hafnia alvei]|uniref:cupin domain-containing protein n=1 Tax=Hafnia alvei TaxID=569 RepID=UPI0010345B38|nr:cupin domain-containing protein [Hafnia alvei]TBL39483.1 cupin domain-containing protein [Hafnia alvei]
MFFFYQNIAVEPAGEGVTRKVLAHGGTMMMVEVCFQAGAIGPLHNHPHEQSTYVKSGIFDFTIGHETHRVSAGDTLYKKPNVMHGCVCVEAGTLIDVFTPQREDFIS